MKKVGLFLSFTLLWIACSDENNDNGLDIPVDNFQSPLNGLPDLGRLQFDNPQVGQRSYYVYFEATKQTVSGGPEFIYKKDTLVYAITGHLDDKWIIKEFLARGSSSKTFEGNFPDTTIVTHYMQVDNDSIHFSLPVGAAFIFSPVGDLSIPTMISEGAIENEDCLPLFGYGTNVWTAMTIHYKQFGVTYDSLNNYFDYTAMAWDGFGFMFVYTGEHGFTRVAWVSAWDNRKANGWDLLP